MPPITLKDAGSSAVIAPEFGFNCYEFKARVGKRTVDVLDSDPDFANGKGRPSGNGIPLLFPFPNRIRAGKFTWDGRDYQIPLKGSPNAIHGFAFDTPWRVVRQSEYSVVGQWQLSRDDPDRAPFWPADCLIEVRYDLRGATLRSDICIRNVDHKPLPCGFGTHAYFKLPLGEGGKPERCLIQAPAHEQWELKDLLPTGRRIPVPPEKDIRDGAYVLAGQFDDVYGDLHLEGPSLDCVIMDELAGLEVVQACDPVFRELVVYAPPRRAAVCMEPYTCVTDAINLEQRGIDAGLRVLEPGGEFLMWIEITARPVVA